MANGSNLELGAELDTAARLAREAGRGVMSFFGDVAEERKEGGSPVTVADHLANRIILDGLRERFPDDGILSEETRDTMHRLQKERVWIIDPLDGTREFISGIGEFAIMIGLAVDGRAVLGAVYVPADDTLYLGVVGVGAWEERGGRRPLVAPAHDAADGLRLVGSRSHSDPRIERIRDALGIRDVRPSGSVGVKCALIARGECNLYAHPVPYLKEWDTCAPEAVLRGAGGDVTDCHGEPLRYNKRDPVQPHGILATSPGVHRAVLDVVRAAFDADPASFDADRDSEIAASS